MTKTKKLKNSEINMVAESVMVNRNVDTSRIGQIFGSLGINWFKSKPVIAMLRLEGVIGKVGVGSMGMSLSSLDALIQKAFNLNRLTAVCLIINSPGGSPVQSELIAKRISQLANEKSVPVYAFVEDVAASGGYWLACSADEIYASRSSIIGSIGVVSRGFGFSDAIKRLGIERRVYTQGNNKSVLDPFKPAKEEDIELIHDIQRDIHQYFIDFVKTRRKGQLTQDDELLFNGKFWSGTIARDYGLIDGIDDAYSFIEKKFGKDVKVEYVKKKQSWLKEKLSVYSNASGPLSKQLTDAMLDSLESKSRYDKFDIY